MLYQKTNFSDDIRLLLEENKLPTEDISQKVQFWIVSQDEQIIGCIGLEVYENYGLLRSFAVKKAYQNQKIGSKLYDFFLKEVQKTTLEALYLVTTTAEIFFQKKDFKVVHRSEVPEIVQQSGQFNGICPASAAVMVLFF